MAMNLERQRKIEAAYRQLENLLSEDLDDQFGQIKSFDDLEMASLKRGDELTRRLLQASTRKRNEVHQH